MLFTFGFFPFLICLFILIRQTVIYFSKKVAFSDRKSGNFFTDYYVVFYRNNVNIALLRKTSNLRDNTYFITNLKQSKMCEDLIQEKHIFIFSVVTKKSPNLCTQT